MDVIAVDDEPLVLRDVARELAAVMPQAQLQWLLLPEKALEHARTHNVDVAFLDVQMPGMSGIELARHVKDLQPHVHIVFVTSHEQYAVDAFALKATGYLLKPVRRDELEREMTFVYRTTPALSPAGLRVRTFGGFEAYVGERPLTFHRAKAKELLALLVDRRGVGVTLREACALLWEDDPMIPSRRSYYQTIVADLRKTLEQAGVGNVLVKSWNSLAIDPSLVLCDSYRFADGDPVAVNAYRGDYLPAYSWAEFSVGRLERLSADRRDSRRDA